MNPQYVFSFHYYVNGLFNRGELMVIGSKNAVSQFKKLQKFVGKNGVITVNGHNWQGLFPSLVGNPKSEVTKPTTYRSAL